MLAILETALNTSLKLSTALRTFFIFSESLPNSAITSTSFLIAKTNISAPRAANNAEDARLAVPASIANAPNATMTCAITFPPFSITSGGIAASASKAVATLVIAFTTVKIAKAASKMPRQILTNLAVASFANMDAPTTLVRIFLIPARGPSLVTFLPILVLSLRLVKIFMASLMMLNPATAPAIMASASPACFNLSDGICAKTQRDPANIPIAMAISRIVEALISA